MPKIRLYLEKEIIKDQKILLSSDQKHYLKNVMRKKNSEKILIFNKESEWECFLNIDNDVSVTPIRFVRSNKEIPDIWICFSIIKPRNINFLVEKVTEIGVKRIVPIETEFSEKINLNISRLKKIIIEAVEQSNAMNLPEIDNTVKIEKLLAEWEDDRIIILCDELGGNSILDETVRLKNSKKTGIFIGPVGGWSFNDKRLFENKQVHRVSLGENILKADTAAIYSLSCLKALIK
ncbi:MAG: RsmE family RNA methyltransferase [Pseudomonadota bacterium]|nr:RsmE family RNA methyltransferase [Pseudomonadota bacterium]